MTTFSKYWKQQSDKKKPKKARMNILPTLILSFGPLFFYAWINRLATVLLQQVRQN